MKKTQMIIISALVFALIPVLVIPVLANGDDDKEDQIPNWVKGVFAFWVDGEIEDLELVDALEFLIDKEVIVIPGYGKIVKEDVSITTLTEDDYELTITTDKKSYVYGETVIISGTLSDYGSNTILMMIVNPDNSIMELSNVLPDGQGTYSKDWKLTSPALMEYGTYVISITYQGEKLKTSFEYNMK